MEEFGIDQVKIALGLIIELGNVTDKMGRSQGMARYMHVTSLFDELMALGNLDADKLKKQIGEVSAEEMLEIKAFLSAKFDIVDNKLELAIEEGISIFTEIYALYKRTSALVTELKAE